MSPVTRWQNRFRRSVRVYTKPFRPRKIVPFDFSDPEKRRCRVETSTRKVPTTRSNSNKYVSSISTRTRFKVKPREICGDKENSRPNISKKEESKGKSDFQMNSKFLFRSFYNPALLTPCNPQSRIFVVF